MGDSNRFRLAVFVTAVLILAETITLVYLSLLPSGIVPTIRTGILRPGDLEHFTSFFIYGALWILLLKTTGMERKVLIVLVIGSFFGLSNEMIQAYVPARVFDPVDWFVDTLGTGVGGTAIARIKGKG